MKEQWKGAEHHTVSVADYLTNLHKKMREMAKQRDKELYDQRTGKAKYISTLDMIKGYYEVLMGEGDREKTAFISTLGKYQLRRMPFGLIESS